MDGKIQGSPQQRAPPVEIDTRNVSGGTELTYDSEHKIESGSMERLVERLTAPDNAGTQSVDPPTRKGELH